jgi:ubiquinone/menaquinone biosynthesis C-methylase UbiE
MGFYKHHVIPHLINLAMRNSQLLPYRERLLARASGRALEIGVGSGMNLPFYSDRVTEIVGLDPHPKLLAMAAHRIVSLPTRLIEGSAESIPLGDCSVDTVVLTWTLCSISDATTAVQEMRRVLRPSGQLLFVEHGLSPDEDVRRWQRRLTPWWKRVAGGCHLDRPISELVGSAGFEIAQVETSYMPGLKPMTFMYEGSARRA